MSNAETVQLIYESWREEKGIPADLVDSEIEWVNPPDAVEPGTRHGPEGVSVALANFSRVYRIAGLEVERMVAAGETVATSVNLTFVGRGSGMEVRNRQSHRFTFRDGKVVRIEWSSDPDRLFEEIDEG